MKSFFAIALLLCVVVAVVSAQGETGKPDLLGALKEFLEGLLKLVANLLKNLGLGKLADAVQSLIEPIDGLLDDVLGKVLGGLGL